MNQKKSTKPIRRLPLRCEEVVPPNPPIQKPRVRVYARYNTLLYEIAGQVHNDTEKALTIPTYDVNIDLIRDLYSRKR